MKKIFPQKLTREDSIAIITPSRSLKLISKDTKNIANNRFKKLGLKLSFGKNVEETNEFDSSSISSRIKDLHWAFSNPDIKGILTVIGGFNSNQLLKYIDWKLIQNNPKILCGYSDITALNNAILAKTGLITYSGPHYSTFGQKYEFEYTLNYFKKCLFSEDAFEVKPSKQWTDDKWYLDQEDRHPINNDGYIIINEGKAAGTIVGSNLCTINLL